MRGYLIDVKNGTHHEVEVKERNRLGQYYDLIGCECIDIAVRRIGGKPYNIVLDDEGLLVDRVVFSGIDSDMRPMLAGNLIIFGMEEGGYELDSLTDEDVRNIKGSVIAAIDFDAMKSYPVVFMEY